MSQLRLVREALVCPICLDFFSDPTTVPCGHSYCTNCIHSHWKHQRNMFTCPQCRKVFYRKTAAVKNIVLTGLVELLKGTPPSAGPCCARPHNVSCEECDWRRRLEDVRSCLGVEGRDRGKKGRRKQKGAPSKQWSNKDNRGKNVEGHLKVSRTRLLQSLQDKQTELETLLQEAQTISRSAQETLQRTEESFTHISLLLDTRRSQVKEQIHRHEKNELSRVRQLQEQIQKDIVELKDTIAERDPLSSDEEEDCPPLSTGDGNSYDTPPPLWARVQPGERRFNEEVTAAVTQLGRSLLPHLDRFSPPQPEPTTREGFLRCACDVSLDPDTGHPWLTLHSENRGVTLRRPLSADPEHPDRFSHYRQVLSREALSGRCYWEVEWSGEGGVRIALSYQDIQRQGTDDDCAFGYNQKSWALDTSDGSLSIWINKERLHLSGPLSPRVGVFLDHAAGVVSFYSVSQNMSLLHRLHTTFTQPLHVGVWFCWGYSGDTVYFPKLKDNPFIKLVSG